MIASRAAFLSEGGGRPLGVLIRGVRCLARGLSGTQLRSRWMKAGVSLVDQQKAGESPGELGGDWGALPVGTGKEVISGELGGGSQ